MSVELMHLVWELAPLRGVVWHKADALKVMQGPSRLVKENIATAAHGGSIKDYVLAPIFKDTVDEPAPDKVLAVNLQAFTLDGSAVNDFHGLLP